MRPLGRRGVALSVAIILILAMTILIAWVMQAAFNFRRLADSLTSAHARAYYRAHAGIVNAHWRIRTGFGMDYFDPANWDTPVSYSLDIDGDAIDDVDVTIGAAALPRRLRTITAVGREF